MRIGITGATGYVGNAVAAEARERGHDVVALTRRQPSSGSEWIHYDLAVGPPDDALAGIDAVVHAAYDLSLTRSEDVARVNIEGTRRLVDACARVGARVCLISSMSAYPGTHQIYGTAKLRSEQDVLAAGGAAVRLGLVYGGENGGMAGVLRRAAGLPVVPVIAAGSHQFLVHVDDMAAGVVAIVESGATAGFDHAVGLAHPNPVRFDELIRGFAGRAKQPRIVRLPWQPLYQAMRVAERLPVSLPVRADSILGLVSPAPFVPRFEVWQELGVEVKPFDPERA